MYFYDSVQQTNKRCFFFFLPIVSYGRLSNSGTSDSNIGAVNIDTTEAIQGVDGVSTIGYVRQIAFNFSSNPTASTAVIWVYVMNKVPPTAFAPASQYQIPPTSIAATAIQTFILPVNALPVVSGQYVGVGFGIGGGNLYQVENRNQSYLLSVTNFAAVVATNYTTLALGISYSYQVLATGIVFG